MTAIDQLKTLKAQIAEKRKAIEAQCKDVFHAESTKVFERHPKLESFSWRQYTPYFNDGEPCEFGVDNDYIDIKFDGKEFEEVGEWTFKSDHRKYHTEEQDTAGLQEAYADIRVLLDTFDEEDYKFMFGDHAEVVATKDGVEVEEYEHD